MLPFGGSQEVVGMKDEQFDEFLEVEEEIDEVDIYAVKARVLLLEDDEMSAEEDGFMEGYDEAS